MGVFKHSPGCGCCGCSNTCASGTANTIDVVIPAASNHINEACTDCGDIAGTYTLTFVDPDDEFSAPIGTWDANNNTRWGSGVSPDDEGWCYWEGGPFSHNVNSGCTPYNSTFWILLMVVDSGGKDWRLRIGDGGTDNGITLTQIVGSADGTMSPSDWRTDDDCTANLEFTLSGNHDLLSCKPGIFTVQCCEFVMGDVFELNP